MSSIVCTLVPYNAHMNRVNHAYISVISHTCFGICNLNQKYCDL